MAGYKNLTSIIERYELADEMEV